MKTPRWFTRWEGAWIVGQHTLGDGFILIHVALPIGGGWMQRAYETREGPNGDYAGRWHFQREW
jgi:hypothetical protein